MYGHRLAILSALIVLMGAGASLLPHGIFASGLAKFGDPAAPMTVYWAKGRIVVGVLPKPNEGYLKLGRRILQDPAGYSGIVKFNRNRSVMRGVRVSIPLNALKIELRGDALRALYPEDDLTERGWSHRVDDPLETLIQLTEAYTGSKNRFKELARYNKLRNPDVLRLGAEIAIPLRWIPDELGFKPLALKPPLTLIKDPATGQNFADYKIRPGDTLYSLLLRFSDRERAAEVRRMSRLLLSINKLKSEHKVQAGRRLRIPVGWLSEKYLVHKVPPRRRSKTARRVQSTYRGGKIHVIVDPGHGGIDAGAVYGKRNQPDRVYEHEVVYDVALRTMKYLKMRGYAAYQTLTDPRQTKPLKTLSMNNLGKERIMVNPPYQVSNASVGVNMRVYLIDSLYRKLIRKKRVAPENILLISIHGDALVPTMRGAMVYYPDHRLRVGEFAPRGRVYRIRKEAVPSLIRYNRAHSRMAMDMSGEFARDLIRAFKRNGVPVSRRKPVRSFYYRDGQRTLPGVLRFSRVPTSVLVEVANLNNAADRKAILNYRTRDRVAKAIVSAVDAFRNRNRAVAKRMSGG